MEALLEFARWSGIYDFMHSAWGWPVVESLHFVGLCLLLGTVGVFDLRLLGIGRTISLAALHQLIPYGIAGFALNVLTGALFFVSAPDQYLFNPAFQTKMFLILLAGGNMLAFNLSSVRGINTFEAPPGRRAVVFGSVSLMCWLLVIVCGRLITYYRPPYSWCFWC